MSDKIYIGIDDKRIELKGKELEAFLEQQNKDQDEQRLLQAEAQAKQAKLDSAKAKLAALGLDEEEVAAIVGGI
jgi:cell division septation protein DedD